MGPSHLSSCDNTSNQVLLVSPIIQVKGIRSGEKWKEFLLLDYYSWSQSLLITCCYIFSTQRTGYRKLIEKYTTLLSYPSNHPVAFIWNFRLMLKTQLWITISGSQQMILHLSWRSILETLAAQDVVAGEDEVAVGVVDVQTVASGLTR